MGALDAFTDGVERRIDLARVNDRVFVNNASLGVYAKVVQSDAYRDAKLETWTRMLPDLLGPDAEPIDLEFTAPDGSSCGDAPLVLVSNNPYQLTQPVGRGHPRADRHGQARRHGRAGARAADVSKLVALELVGQAGRFPGLLSWSTQEFEVRSSGPVEVGLDGEALVLDPPLRFVSHAGRAARAAAPRSRPVTGRPRGGALTGQPRRAAAGGCRQVRRPAARLVLGLVVFVLVGWGAGELWTSSSGQASWNRARSRAPALGGADRVRGSSPGREAPCCWFRSRSSAASSLCGRACAGRRVAVAVSLGGAMLISDVVKLLVSRPRPPVEHLQSVSGSSFPSGHATQASAFWFSLVLAARTARAAPLLTRSLAAVARAARGGRRSLRVYLGVHYPSDVIAGVLLGTGWAVYRGAACGMQRSGTTPGRALSGRTCSSGSTGG